MEIGIDQQSGTIKQQADVMRAGMAALGQHVDNMRKAGQQAGVIQQEIAKGYIANSSTVFQRKVDDWVTRYNQIMNSFQDLQTATHGAMDVMGNTDQELMTRAASWGGDAVYATLTGQ